MLLLSVLGLLISQLAQQEILSIYHGPFPFPQTVGGLGRLVGTVCDMN